jgi:hypothetical protein
MHLYFNSRIQQDTIFLIGYLGANKAAPAPADRKIAALDDATAALLLPAVQKVREAAARLPAWEGCAAGQKIERLAIQQKSTGRMGRILDATVATCASESVSFNFTKIEWD